MTKTNSEAELVTIQVPTAWARAHAEIDSRRPAIYVYSTQDAARVKDACQAALDARKSKLERWRETISIPREMLHCKTSWSANNAKLMAAAPLLLEALITVMRDTSGEIDPEGWESCAYEAIRAAVPEEVAAEILGES
jgi:hypothetical protein